MPVQAPEVLADPVGVIVELISRAEPTLDRATIQGVVASVAGGRAKRRRLAQALLDNPPMAGPQRPVRSGTCRSRCAPTARSASRRRCVPSAASRCGPCRVDRRLRELLGDQHGRIRPELQSLHRSLAATDHPDTVLSWLGKNTGAAVLRELGSGTRPLSHAALDALPDSKPLRHLRSMLVAAGALPARDEHLARLQRWITRTISGRDDPDQRQLLHRYADWHLLRRLRQRTGDAAVTHGQFATVRQHLRGAIVLLDWLAAQDLTEDRVAGLLVLLYAQWPSVVSRLTLDHVHTDGNQVRLRLGREPVVLPEPLAGLVLDLVATRRGHAALGDQSASRWLFPGGMPGRPLSAGQLGERLRQLGLRPGQARSTALFQLATELPAAILARLLGIHITVAVAWQRRLGRLRRPDQPTQRPRRLPETGSVSEPTGRHRGL